MEPGAEASQKWAEALARARRACAARGLRGDDLEDAARDAALELVRRGDSRRWAVARAVARATRARHAQTDREPSWSLPEELLCAALSIRCPRLSAYAVRRVLGDCPREAAEAAGYRAVRNAELRFRREMRRILNADDPEQTP